jgi:uncharacterized protein with PhoU and TrkA domain
VDLPGFQVKPGMTMLEMYLIMRILALEDSIFWILVVDSQRDYLLRKDDTLIVREEREK